MSMDKLIQKIVAMNNPTVAGLDPKLDFIPGYIKEKAVAGYGNTLKAAAEALYEFNVGLIDALCDIVPAVKPQCAYYEMYGAEGVDCLARTIRYAKAKGMYVITDGKRNDIGTTMEAYAKGHLGQTQLIDGSFVEPFGGDALTVNGYLGSDGIKPLLETCKQQDKGIFVLVKTSNPSSGERGEYGYSAVGAVVGATYPEQLTELREKLPHTFFLVPGYGAQGGGAQDVAGAFKDGIGAVVNSSRGIMCAYKKQELDERAFAEAARAEAIRMRDDIMSVVK